MRTICTILLSLSVSYLTLGCRTARRATNVAGATQDLLIQMLNLQAADQANPNVVAELHRCQGTEIVQGRFQDATMANFPIKGIKPGTVCEVRVLYPNAPQDKYLFLAEPNLLYIAPNVVISQAVTGKLQATAILAKKYNLNLPVEPAKSFKITASVEFPADVSGSAALINAQLFCDPAIATVAPFMPKSATAGTFEFPAPIDSQVSAHLCKGLNVFVNGNWQYQGKINNGEGRKIIPAPAATIAAEDKPIKLQAISTQQSTGVTVQTIDGGSCAANEVFDIRTRQCVKAQP